MWFFEKLSRDFYRWIWESWVSDRSNPNDPIDDIHTSAIQHESAVKDKKAHAGSQRFFLLHHGRAIKIRSHRGVQIISHEITRTIVLVPENYTSHTRQTRRVNLKFPRKFFLMPRRSCFRSSTSCDEMIKREMMRGPRARIVSELRFLSRWRRANQS